MEDLLFQESLESYNTIREDTEYLEVLNFDEPKTPHIDQAQLREGDHFQNFIRRKGIFDAVKILDGATFKNGLRLIIQPLAVQDKTFAEKVLPLEKKEFEAMVSEMRLSLRVLEATSAVGPFLWWRHNTSKSSPVFEILFRKSDVKWTDDSKGWELATSYSFDTRLTSGFVKGTKKASIPSVIRHLKGCVVPAAHPLLLPFLILKGELSSENDNHQRHMRSRLRNLEKDLTGRYADENRNANANIRKLDTIDRDLTDCHCQVLWKRPKAWQTTVKGMTAAAETFWAKLPEEDQAQLSIAHDFIVSGLDFLRVKYEGMESYTDVTLERLNLQREVMHSILEQRQSRLNFLGAVQQYRLSELSRADSLSMKTLALLGAFFLPGTFLSSMFSMSFFDFNEEMSGPVSGRLWIYFAVMIPLTGLTVGAWFAFDKFSRHMFFKNNTEESLELDLDRMGQLDIRMTEHIAKRVGARVMTRDLADMDARRSEATERRRSSFRLRQLNRQTTEGLGSNSLGSNV